MRVVRTTVEATVLVVGFALGGTVGIGTVLYALAIGPITHRTIPALDLSVRTKAGGGLPAPEGKRAPAIVRLDGDPCRAAARVETAAAQYHDDRDRGQHEGDREQGGRQPVRAA